MNMVEKEKSLLVKVGIVVAVSYGITWGAEKFVAKYSSDVRGSNSTLKNELGEYTAKLAEIEDEEVLQSQYVETYNSYRDRNWIVGPAIIEDAAAASEIDEANRLFLLERLQQIKNERKFFEITYSLTKPQNLPATFSELTDASDVAIRANVMNIKMPLLHGLDLLMLLNDFHDGTTNRFTPTRCILSFVGDDDDDQRDQGLLQLNENINSECDLVWLSVYDPKQGKDVNEEVEGESTAST